MKISSSRGFYPYMMVVFFNAFVDLGHKVLIQDTLYQTTHGAHYTIFATIINALILLPYLLLFTPSGFISDKFAKVRVLRITAAVAIPLTLLVTWCYYEGYFWGAFVLTLTLAMQSAINSPAKYGYIKEVFGKDNIARANALVQTLTIIAILVGTYVFTLLFTHYLDSTGLLKAKQASSLLRAFAPAGWILVLCATFETAMTFCLPKKAAADPCSQYHISRYLRGQYVKPYLQLVKRKPVIFTCIIGLALFWSINQVLLAGYGAFLKEYVANASALFAQSTLAMGGVGILLGALYAGKVSKGFIETGLIPVGALGITLGLFLLPITLHKYLIMMIFLGYGFFGGMLIVPLNSLIQFNASKTELGKVLAANNFLQNVLMIGFLCIIVILTLLGANSLITLYGLFIVAVAGTIYTFFRLPQSLLRYIIYFVVSKFYRLKVHGLEHLPSTGGVLLLGNHTSYIDWAILQIACPRPIRFVMERTIYEKPSLHWILRRLKIIPISRSASKQSIQDIHDALNQGDIIALFPEGRLSRNGQIGHFHSGFERAIKDTSAVIVPFYLRGLWGTPTSRASKYYKQMTRERNRHVSVTYGETLSTKTTAVQLKQIVHQLSIRSWKCYTESLSSLPIEWINRSKRDGNQLSIIDGIGAELSNYKLIAAVWYFTHKLQSQFSQQQNIGIILPASAGGVIANLTVLCCGKTVVNLNYTSGLETLHYAIKKAEIKTIISSRLFIKKIKVRGLDLTSLFNTVNVIYLEDYKKASAKVVISQKMLLCYLLPTWLLKVLLIKHRDVNSTATILFSSGSEGLPKGVELTHRNILGNIKQVSSVFNIQDNDRVLNILPLFHAFGLTITTFMPLIEGVPFICYPDPTNAEAIGKLAYANRATVLCGTSTFLGIYTRSKKLLPMMFQSLRLVLAGAEKLSPEVREAFKQKFNCDIYEGYGATEVAPVASCNLPNLLSTDDWQVHHGNKIGSVGLPLPGSAFRIVDPESNHGLAAGEDGLILIGGTQVMRGYLDDPAKTQSVLIQDGDITWYRSGDKGHLDDDGYLTIVDRYSRFAKIGGEMISLTRVEQLCLSAIDDAESEVMALALPDDKKGERIYLIYTAKLEITELRQRLTEANIDKLMLPSHYLHLDELPKLGTGKRDYVSAKKLLEKTDG